MASKFVVFVASLAVASAGYLEAGHYDDHSYHHHEDGLHAYAAAPVAKVAYSSAPAVSHVYSTLQSAPVVAKHVSYAAPETKYVQSYESAAHYEHYPEKTVSYPAVTKTVYPTTVQKTVTYEPAKSYEYAPVAHSYAPVAHSYAPATQYATKTVAYPAEVQKTISYAAPVEKTLYTQAHFEPAHLQYADKDVTYTAPALTKSVHYTAPAVTKSLHYSAPVVAKSLHYAAPVKTVQYAPAHYATAHGSDYSSHYAKSVATPYVHDYDQHYKVAAVPAVQYAAAAPVVAAKSVHYSPAEAVSHASFQGVGVHYQW